MVTIYKSTDVSAPVMTSGVGSLLAVLDACLVNGFGSKAGAGWGRTVIDAATYQTVYTQGVGSDAALPRKKIYIKDDATTPGNARAWACDSCTVAATPTLTNFFWDINTTSSMGVIVKADQDNGEVAKWMVVASDRWAYVFTKRSNWGTRGWQVTFFGDLESAYPTDKGCFAVLGFSTSNGNTIAIGGSNRTMCSTYIGVYGNQDGTFAYNSYPVKRLLANYGGYADTLSPKSEYASGLLLTKIVAVEAVRYRGALPRIFRTVSSLDVFSWYMLPDEYVIQTQDGSRSFMQVQFGGIVSGITSEPGRIFLELTGAL